MSNHKEIIFILQDHTEIVVIWYKYTLGILTDDVLIRQHFGLIILFQVYMCNHTPHVCVMVKIFAEMKKCYFIFIIIYHTFQAILSLLWWWNSKCFTTYWRAYQISFHEVLIAGGVSIMRNQRYNLCRKLNKGFPSQMRSSQLISYTIPQDDWHWECSVPARFPACTPRPMKLLWRNAV